MLLPRLSALFRQLLAALVAAAAQDDTAGTGGHALHKAVLFGVVALFGLVGSFWHMFSLYRMTPPGASQGVHLFNTVALPKTAKPTWQPS